MMFRADYFCFENLHFHFTNIEEPKEIHKKNKAEVDACIGCFNEIRFGGISIY